MSFDQILVALDQTSLADQVFERSVDLAIKYDARLLLLHCTNAVSDLVVNQALQPAGIAHPWPSTMLTERAPWETTAAARDIEQQQAQAARQWLMQYQQQAQDLGCRKVDFDVRTGRPSEVINEVAQGVAADLIVVGCRDRAGIEEFLLGSVSKSVVNHASCAVLIVPQ